MPRAPLLAFLGAIAALLAGCGSIPPRPHGSDLHGLADHFDPQAWREYVGRDYLATRRVVLPVALGLGAALVAPVDDPLSEELEGTLGGGTDVADAGVYALVGGALALGVAAPGPGRTPWDQTWSNVEALFLTYGLTEAGKAISSRERPGRGANTSFPSGHSATAFAAATLIHREAGPAWGLPAYGVAALTAWSRVDEGRHHVTDVLAGAALGCLAAGVVDSLHFGAGPGRGIVGRCRIHAGPTEDGFCLEASLDL